MINENIKSVKNEILNMEFEKPPLKNLTWNFNNYQQIYEKGREGGDPDRAPTPVTELIPSISPFEE